MRRLLVVAAAGLGACTVGPKYKPETVIAPGEQVGAPRLSDSSRHFCDSLAVERAKDSLPAGVFRAPRSTFNAAAANADAWLDILHDSTLVQLVDVALRQNRDIQMAVARINEFRADVGVARGPLVPSVTVNGSESTNQVALGAFPPTSFRAARLTGDLAWALDFGGRLRRGV